MQDRVTFPAYGDTPAGHTGTVACQYRMPAFYRAAALAFSAVMLVLLIGFVIAPTQISGVFVLLVAVFVILTAWVLYRTLFRRAYDLDLQMNQLRWKAPLVGGQVFVDDLSKVRPSRIGSGIWIFERRGAANVSVPVRKGFREFLQELQSVRRDLPLDPRAWSIDFTESLLGSSGFSQDT